MPAGVNRPSLQEFMLLFAPIHRLEAAFAQTAAERSDKVRGILRVL
jgi:hypothetical protein